MSRQLDCTLVLPANFRRDDILTFHRRDPQQFAERVTRDQLQKGLVWNGSPACLEIRFRARRAEAKLHVDGHVGRAGAAAFEAMIRRMLGMTQDVAAFERAFADHPQAGALIRRQKGLRVPAAATPFEALTWAVAGQQISVAAAVALRRKLIAAANLRHSGGLFCYPDAPQVAALGRDDLRQAGFSEAKSETLALLARAVAEGELPLQRWGRTLPIEEMRQALIGIRGIGPWTVNYVLLRGYGWLDGSLHGDIAVRRSLQSLLDARESIGERKTEAWLAQFSPWRALVAAHLWAARHVAAA